MANQITPAQTFNKFETVIMVQEYVNGYGWTDAGACSTSKEAKEMMKEYRNEGIQVQVIRRRELVKDAFLCQALLKFCRDHYLATGGMWPELVEVLKSNGVVKFKLNLNEIKEILGEDCFIVTSVAV